jgi:hypothetical protein
MDTKNDKTGAERPPQAEVKHPPESERDLNPEHMAGQNVGWPSDVDYQGMPTAYDWKDVHRALNDAFADDELRQIPVLPEGERLQQGATYVDLRDPARREFTARGDMSADPAHRYVAKDAVPYSLWNRLVGVDDPERLAERRPADLDG